MLAVDFLQRQRAIIEQASELTKAAIAKASGAMPTWTEARTIEVAAAEYGSQSEAKTKERLRDEAMDAHLSMMDALFNTRECEAER